VVCKTHGFLALNRGPRTSLAAESRADLYLAHVSSREKYKMKKEIMPDSVCGMGLVCTCMAYCLPCGGGVLEEGTPVPSPPGAASPLLTS